MRYVRVYATDEGDSRFEQVDVAGQPMCIVDGLFPLLVSGPFPVRATLFVEEPKAAASWPAHVAPKRQWIVVLRGRFEVTVTNGERREFGPGDIILAEDTVGKGHCTRFITDDVAVVMIPIGE